MCLSIVAFCHQIEPHSFCAPLGSGLAHWFVLFDIENLFIKTGKLELKVSVLKNFPLEHAKLLFFSCSPYKYKTGADDRPHPLIYSFRRLNIAWLVLSMPSVFIKSSIFAFLEDVFN